MQPHCDYDAASISTEAALREVDIVVTPVVNQELIAYPLVSLRCAVVCCGKACDECFLCPTSSS